jgi:histidinol-phosphate phosphatase family protein
MPLPPLPGTEPPLRALFVDRWGTLAELPERGHVKCFTEVRFVPGAIDALFRAQQAGWRIYLIGNEDAVAHGHLPDNAWESLEGELLEHLSGMGVHVHRNYACLDHPDGRPPHKKPSVFLLPDTGLLYHAAQSDGVELRVSWVVGDSTLELSAGERAGCHVAGVRTGLGLRDGTLEVEPAFVGASLERVVDALLGAAR